jgi:hypothetical protein
MSGIGQVMAYIWLFLLAWQIARRFLGLDI